MQKRTIKAKISSNELELTVRALRAISLVGSTFGDSYDVYNKPFSDLIPKITAQHFENGELTLTEQEFDTIMDSIAGVTDILWWIDRHSNRQPIMDLYQRFGALSLGYIDENGVYQYYDEFEDAEEV